MMAYEHGEVHAYYYGFELTGVQAIDAILTYVERIQNSADEAADTFVALGGG